VRLASRLCGWDIDIKTRDEFEAEGFTRADGTTPEGESAEGNASAAEGEGEDDVPAASAPAHPGS
jgi:transcription antitermination factor NusA-like protein